MRGAASKSSKDAIMAPSCAWRSEHADRMARSGLSSAAAAASVEGSSSSGSAGGGASRRAKNVGG